MSADTATQLQFVASHTPALAPGVYTVSVEQAVVADGTHTFRAAGGQALRFEVAGPRFTLAEDAVVGVYPPDGGLDDYQGVLPHVLLRSPTLPWMREAGAGVPWLAVLLFAPGEKAQESVISLAELRASGALGVPAITLEAAQSDDDRVHVVDVDAAVLRALLPAGDALAWATHGREALDAADAVVSELAVVVGGRIPGATRGRFTAHLVSLEGRLSGGAFAFTQAGDTVRLVSLKRWSFSNRPAPVGFAETLTGLDRTPSTLRLPDPDGGLPEAAAPWVQRGCVPLAHHLRDGGRAASWYRGPLQPEPHDVELALPARAADSLLRFDPALGMLDVSYAAAWELGRSLMLAAKDVSTLLFRWKKAHSMQLRRAEQALAHAHLASDGGLDQGDPGPLPPAVDAWFTALRDLEAVPFPYLVPHERLLPPESIRFFQVDPTWIDALVDGAFSVGRVRAVDHAHDQDRRDVVARDAAAAPLSGILIRSALVSAYPGLLADAYDRSAEEPTATALQQLPSLRLGPDVLMLRYRGALGGVRFHLKPETLHFGLDPSGSGFVKRPRDASGGAGAAVAVPWADADRRVLDLAALAAAVGATDSADFALKMIEGVPFVDFTLA
ncbi:MAG: hypothetical protein H6739_28040 [Alphaproteobacteria bacterium]|nr:hypothetical protein [Alphaproteobacteria bacterium]